MSWHADGLRFGCTQCGDCCTGTPGYVWVGPEDEEAIAARLGLSKRRFRKQYTRLVHGRLSLVEQPAGDCIFLNADRGCSIEEVKPRQCVAFPFWARATASRNNWNVQALDCPGMNHGPRFRSDEIDAISDVETPREQLCRIFDSKKRG